MTDNPFDVEPPSISVTIKYGKDDPWIVFKGNVDQVFDQMCKTFGYEPVGDMTLHDLTIQCQNIANGTSAVTRVLGGNVAKVDVEPKNVASEPSAGVQSAKVHDDIKKAKTVQDLNNIWARNKDAFKSDKSLGAAAAERKAQIENGGTVE